MIVKKIMQSVLSFMHLIFVHTTPKNMFFSIMDINNFVYPYQSFIQVLIQNPLKQPVTLVKGIIGYAQLDVSLNDYQKTNHRID